MAQEFLAQLLRIENTVPKDENDAETCMICLESYGSLNSATGSIELPIRLPCNHLGKALFCFSRTPPIPPPHFVLPEAMLTRKCASGNNMHRDMASR